MSDDVEKILACARTVRMAIKAIPAQELPDCLWDFPRSASAPASLLLGAYLADMGERDFAYVAAERAADGGAFTSHGWLQRAALIVDITADQFDDAPMDIIVTDDSPWHDRFHRWHPVAGDFRLSSGAVTQELHNFYPQLERAIAQQT